MIKKKSYSWSTLTVSQASSLQTVSSQGDSGVEGQSQGISRIWGSGDDYGAREEKKS